MKLVDLPHYMYMPMDIYTCDSGTETIGTRTTTEKLVDDFKSRNFNRVSGSVAYFPLLLELTSIYYLE